MKEAQIVVLGGGFAGVTLVRRLEKLTPRGCRIVLISAGNSITYSPLLPEVVSASMLPGHVVAPIRQMLKRARFVMGEVTAVDLEARRVHYRPGLARGLDYDRLILACGAVANLAIIPGMAEHALPLKTVDNALHIRNRLLERLEQAEVEEDDDRRRQLCTFIVIGGGFSGAEIAGQIADLPKASLRYYPSIGQEHCRVVIVHDLPRFLPELSEPLGGFALARMRRRGIEVRLESKVARVHDGGVELAWGEQIEGANVIATIGTAPTPLVRDLPVAKQRGRIETAADMSVPDRPGVWALGDCAMVPNHADGGLVPSAAQAAARAAEWLADNLVRSLGGEPTRPFAFRARGQLAAIGDQRAVAEIYGWRIGGFVAWVLWRGFYLAKFPTWWRKVRVGFEWLWSCLFPADVAYLGFARTVNVADRERTRNL